MAWHDRDYNQYEYRSGPSMMQHMGGQSVVFWLLCINAAVFMLDAVLGGSRRGSFLAPGDWGAFSVGKGIFGLQLWRVITYQFLHGSFFHVFFNMLALYFFGPLMERWWGSKRFLAFYLLCGIGGAALYTGLSFVPDLLGVSLRSTLVGASGCVFGILAGCAMLYPHQRVMLIFPPIPMTMRTMALVFLGLGAMSVIVGSRNAGGEAAHLGGAAIGWLLIKYPRSLSFVDRHWAHDFKQRQQKKHRQAAAKEDVQVDQILQKVREHGLASLTNREKKILQRATDRQRRAG